MDILNQLSAMPLSTLVALGAVVLIGLPHGALDGAIAFRLGLLDDSRSLFRFIAVYLSAGLAVVLFWFAMPAVALCVFLAVSLIHFGLGDARTGDGIERGLEVLAHGGLVIAGISQFHRSEVDVIFGYLANGDTTWVWGVVDGIAFMVVAASLFCGAKAIVYPEWRRNGVELALTGSLFWLCPPLVGFALYFCLLHSSRHIRTVFQKLPGTLRRREILWQALGFTLACWFAAAWAFWGLATAGPIDAALLRVVFIGLAALTLPHIVLVDGLLEKPWATSKASREARSFYLPGQEPCESPLAPVRMHPNA